jgi:hypothetical protein
MSAVANRMFMNKTRRIKLSKTKPFHSGSLDVLAANRENGMRAFMAPRAVYERLRRPTDFGAGSHWGSREGGTNDCSAVHVLSSLEGLNSRGKVRNRWPGLGRIDLPGFGLPISL